MPSENLPNVVKKDGTWTVDGRPRETIQPLGQFRPSNIPGKVVVVLLLTMPPTAATPPHTHSGAAVIGLMLQGSSVNQMNADPAKNYREGEIWFESPGCHHVRSENANEKEGEDAKFYAVVIVDEDKLEKYGQDALFAVDAEQEEKKEKEQKL